MVSARHRRIVALLVLGAALAVAAWRLTPFVTDALSPGDQSRNLRLAQEFISAHEQSIRGDSRFQQVDLITFTGRGGCIMVIGIVASAADAQDLKRLISAKQPPVEVRYDITSTAPPTI
jgi:hypothetical protein